MNGKRGVDAKIEGHECPANGCRTRVRPDKLLCGPHWALVPGVLARAVYAAWRHGHGQGSLEHLRACDDAVDAVNRHIAARGR